MPKKRSKFWSRNKKEKQLITARLIEISMKIDGYVYNHQPITESDAKTYIKEVVSYKTLCSGDERSLQVIEKLTRCMNAVIVEHKEKRGDICNLNNGRSVPDDDFRASCTSPVYSISDEDRTQLTQIAEENGSNKDTNKDIEFIDLSNIDDDEVIDKDITHTGTVADVNPRLQVEVEVDIHRAISNLSLKEVEDLPDITTSNADHSVSILNSFKGIENLGQNIANVASKEATTNGFRENFADLKKTRVLKADQNAHASNINNVSSEIQNNESALVIQSSQPLKSRNSNAPNKTGNLKEKTIAHKTDSVKKSSYQNNNNKTIPKAYPFMNSPDRQRQTWDDNTALPDTSHKTQQGQIYKDVNLISNTFNKTAYINAEIPIKTVEVQHASAARTKSEINNNNPIVKKKSVPRKKKVLSEDGNKPKNKIKNVTPKHTKKKVSTNLKKDCQNIPIYNKNVENDLSWIENLRYVREIKEDEHDSNLIIEESFWDNYYLPGNWNENEFL